MMYSIINDPMLLDRFIFEWLPELRPGEQFYGALFARKKYDSTGTITSDKGQLKRFVSTKEFLVQKIWQLECRVGSYSFNGRPVPQEALALYIMPNPRSFKGALTKSLVDIAKLISNGDFERNPKQMVMTNLQKSASRKVVLDFDFDNMVYSPHYFDFINEDCLTVLSTRGGFHVLVELKKIDPSIKSTWYKKMVEVGCDVRGDNLIPVPGCVQGGYTPYFY